MDNQIIELILFTDNRIFFKWKISGPGLGCIHSHLNLKQSERNTIAAATQQAIGTNVWIQGV